MGKHPDLDRINDLTSRLEDLCREAEYIRDRIRNVSGQPSIWPDRFRALQADTDHAVASELNSPGRDGG